MIKNLEYVFTGKNYLSIQRAETRKNELLVLGYKILSENSKKTTFVKNK